MDRVQNYREKAGYESRKVGRSIITKSIIITHDGQFELYVLSVGKKKLVFSKDKFGKHT